MPASIGRFLRTIRYLKPVQVLGRLWFRIYRPRARAAGPVLRWPCTKTWAEPARRRASVRDASSFFFLNEEGTLARGWDDPRYSKLWRYNLHYFDDLNAWGAGARRDWHADLIARWIADNDAGVGTGWEPYPTSLRIVNWIKWALSGNALSSDALCSLAVQADWLARRVEWHILGNHLFSNAKALVFAGAFLDCSRSPLWLAKGLQILRSQMPEQVLSDGGHFERSPMYHLLATEDFLDLANLAACFPKRLADLRAACENRIPTMLAWMQAMRHPDGEIAFFNDAAIGVAPTPSEILAYASRLGFVPPISSGQTFLRDSGFARLAAGNDVLITDVGPIGPDYLPGHAHADSLSFELSVGSRRLIVNSGTSVYGTGSERLRQRGTAAHNTVIIDGRDSSEVWSGFRVGRRARTSGVRVGPDSVEASHDGYRFLPGRPQHCRRWQLSPGRLRVLDHVSNCTLPAQARFHFHPDASIRIYDDLSGTIERAGSIRLSWRAKGASVTVETSKWHPEFGVDMANEVLIIQLLDGCAEFDLTWK